MYNKYNAGHLRAWLSVSKIKYNVKSTLPNSSIVSPSSGHEKGAWWRSRLILFIPATHDRGRLFHLVTNVKRQRVELHKTFLMVQNCQRVHIYVSSRDRKLRSGPLGEATISTICVEPGNVQARSHQHGYACAWRIVTSIRGQRINNKTIIYITFVVY